MLSRYAIDAMMMLIMTMMTMMMMGRSNTLDESYYKCKFFVQILTREREREREYLVSVCTTYLPIGITKVNGVCADASQDETGGIVNIRRDICVLRQSVRTALFTSNVSDY